MFKQLPGQDLSDVSFNPEGFIGLAQLLQEADPREVTVETAHQYLSRYYPQLTDGQYRGIFCKKLMAGDRKLLVHFNVGKLRKAIMNALLSFDLYGRNLAPHSFCKRSFITLHGQQAEAIMVAAQELEKVYHRYQDDISKAVLPEMRATFSDDQLGFKLESLHLLLSGARDYGYLNNEPNININYKNTISEPATYVAGLITKFMQLLMRYYSDFNERQEFCPAVGNLLAKTVLVLSDLIAHQPMNFYRENDVAPYNTVNILGNVLASGTDSMTAMDLIECVDPRRYQTCASIVEERMPHLPVHELRRKLSAKCHHVNLYCLDAYLGTLFAQTKRWQNTALSQPLAIA